MLNNFIHKLKLDNKSELTIQSYCDRLQGYFNFANNQITQSTLDQYLLHKKSANSTTNLFLSALKKYCLYNNIELNFPERRKKEKKIRTFINHEDLYDKYICMFNLMFNNYRKQTLLFKFLFYTGLRKDELVKLRRENIDFVNKKIFVKNTKSNVDREIPIHKDILNDVSKYFELYAEETNAFNVNRYQIDYIFKIINKDFKLSEKLTPHSMRRSFARYYSEIGFSDTQIMYMLGHSNISQTLEYLQTDASSVMKKAELLNI